MQAVRRIAAVLIFPAIVCLASACERAGTPAEARSPAGAFSLSSPLSSPDGGGRFLLGGAAELDQDPENPGNDVIRITLVIPPGQCVAPTYQNCPFGTVSRAVNVKIDQLDNMLEFKEWFNTVGVGKTCVGGSPRLQVAVDLDGDGNSNGNIFLDTGISGSGSGCPPQTWLYEDFTGGDGITGVGAFPSTGFTTPNEEPECSASQLGGPGVPGAGVPWSVCEAFVNTYPNHLVCTVALVDDAFLPAMEGTAYYDLFSAGNATLTNRSDVAGRGFAKGCGKPDDDDRDVDGDHDRDHDHDADDEKFQKDREERWKS